MTNQNRTRSLIFVGRLSHNAKYDTIAGDPVYETVAHYAAKLTWYSRVNFEACVLGYANTEKRILIQILPHVVIPETLRRLTVPAAGGKWAVESTVDSFMSTLSRSHLNEFVYLRVDFIE